MARCTVGLNNQYFDILRVTTTVPHLRILQSVEYGCYKALGGKRTLPKEIQSTLPEQVYNISKWACEVKAEALGNKGRITVAEEVSLLNKHLGTWAGSTHFEADRDIIVLKLPNTETMEFRAWVIDCQRMNNIDVELTQIAATLFRSLFLNISEHTYNSMSIHSYRTSVANDVMEQLAAFRNSMLCSLLRIVI